eukprot:TRINITY_DN4916_c0_g1_i1.p1 TRINITY_DN4916_c0_g1~~TRINITY_DN4916_c0_g1_i1.p1  ORF type:complete len:148 (+),score=28.12 TRINITY_DN4916_c0_g1_i1:75-518(+)
MCIRDRVNSVQKCKKELLVPSEESVPIIAPAVEVPINLGNSKGAIQTLHDIVDNESINKKLKQQEYMKQLQEQIKERERIRQEENSKLPLMSSNSNFNSAAQYWIHRQQVNFDSIAKAQDQPINKSVSSITESRRGYVQNRAEVSIG